MSNSFLNLGRSAPKLIPFLAAMIIASSVMAQTGGTGALTGTITDSSGAVVRDAKVTATSADTGQTRTATTGAEGTYSLNLLPPGNYKIRFEATGFQATEIPAAKVNVTETAVLDQALQVGAATQTVTVESSVETVQTTSSALGTVANATTIVELPLNTRNYTNLLTMTAGANSSVSNASTLGKGSPLIAVNGSGTSQNTYLQDGVTVNNWYSFNTGVEGVAFGSFVLPPPDAITEFKIQTSNYDAGYGRGPGASVNVITRSGTNAFHGTGFEFFRNTELNANDWFRNYNGQSRGVLNSNQYGGVFGGPVKKDKLFFFTSYQETGQKNGLSGYGSSNVTLPPIPGGNRGTCPPGWSSLSQCDAATPAFVSALAAAMSPTAPCSSKQLGPAVAGIGVLCPANGGGPLYNINPVAISILQLKLPASSGGGYMIPTPANPTGFTSFSIPAIFKDHNGMGSFDYLLSNKHTLIGRYQYERDPLEAPFPVLNANLSGNFLPGHPITTTKGNHASMLKLTSILSPSMVNDAHVAWQRNDVLNSIGTTFTNSQVGIANLEPKVDVLSFLTIGAGTSGFAFGGQYQFGGTFHDNQFIYGDQLSWTRGKHTLRAGFDVQQVRFTQVYQGARAIGNPTFTRFADFLIGRASCLAFTGTGACGPTNPGNTNGNAAASNISTVGNFTSVNSGDTHYLFHAWDLSGFVQDDIKLSQRLTVNLGVRWEYDGYPTEAHGNFSNFAPSLASGAPPTCPVLVTISCTTTAGTLTGILVPNNYAFVLPSGVTRANNNGPALNGAPFDDFAPRVGFAWQPIGSNKWVIRGGAGMFYDLIAGSTYLNPITISAPGLGQPQINGLSASTLANPWVASPAISAGPGEFGFKARWLNPTTPTGPISSDLTLTSVDPNITVPVTYQWNINTQWEFLPTWLLEVGYVGSHGVHQGLESQASQQGQIANMTGSNIAPLAGPGCASCQIYGVTTNTTANVVLRVPQLGVSAQNPTLSTLESYKFNGLEVTVRKQMSHGFQVQGAYTWSRAFITTPFGINTAPYLVHVYQPNNNYRPQRFVLNYVWNLPTGHPKSALRHLVSDWSLSGVTTVQTGQHMSITNTAGNIFLGGNGANSTSWIGGTTNLCPGVTHVDLLSSGSLEARVTSGLTGGTGYFNKTGVICPAPTIGIGLGFGNLGGGVVIGPGQVNFDTSLAKNFTIREGQTLQFRSEFFNLFNHAQFGNPNLSAAQTTFGQITSTSVSPRVIQLALKYSF